ncbi:MAG: hypothetical protein U1E10_19095, partial [Bdellovibrionales bacterium]|nr:hypothetical protein [Bdellovibrionales bacterium]
MKSIEIQNHIWSPKTVVRNFLTLISVLMIVVSGAASALGACVSERQIIVKFSHLHDAEHAHDDNHVHHGEQNHNN